MEGAAIMNEIFFPLRLTHLRLQKGVSAREMSLSLGLCPGYINAIENGKSLPSMQVFFYICEYLEITPFEFWNPLIQYPAEQRKLLDMLQHLAPDQFKALYTLIETMHKK